MTDEEILRKKLDRLNENSYYGIMTDTEITKIVRSHIKRLEEIKMNDIYPLVVVLDRYNGTYSGGKWTAWNMDYSDIPKEVSGDDIECLEFFAIHHLLYGRGETPQEAIYDLECMLQLGSHIPKEHIKAVSESTEDEEDNEMKATSVQVINNVKDMSVTIEKSVLEETRIIISVSTDDDTYEINCSGTGCEKFLRKNDFVHMKEYEYVQNQLMEREKEIRELKQQLQKAERDKKSLAGSYERLDGCYKGLLKDNKNLIKCKESLKSDLDLQKAANEAQRKFIKEYAGNDTEVTFNYAIDSRPITYGLYDKDYVDELRKKNNNLIAENAELKAKLCYKAKSADDIKKLKEQIEEPSSRRDILRCAEKCVCGHREQDYGTPESNFKIIADLWNDYLGNNLSKDKRDFEKELGVTHKHKELSVPWEISAMDVSMMMALLKIARIRNGGGSGDSFVDLAGYAACGGEIWAGQKHQKDQN